LVQLQEGEIGEEVISVGTELLLEVFLEQVAVYSTHTERARGRETRASISCKRLQEKEEAKLTGRVVAVYSINQCGNVPWSLTWVRRRHDWTRRR